MEKMVGLSQILNDYGLNDRLIMFCCNSGLKGHKPFIPV